MSGMVIRPAGAGGVGFGRRRSYGAVKPTQDEESTLA